MAASSIALLLLSTTAAAAYTPRRRVQPPKALLRTVRGGSSAAQDTASAPPPAAVHPTWAPLAPLAIGAATAGLGAAYAAALRASLRVVWRGLPAQRWLVPAITTAGGVAVGGVAIAGGGFFGVGNYVAAARGAAPWPRARAVGPLLAASLLTTAAGLSVGPEAPMVAAGAVCGAALARRYRLDEREAAFAGAAGALTAFLGFPIAGAVFVHELATPGADMAAGLAPTALATIGAALAGWLLKGGTIGGHFRWGAVEPLSARAYVLACGVGAVGALVGGAFVAGCDAVRALGAAVAAARVLVRAGAGLGAGLLALRYPQSLFWGEQSLQMAIDGVSAPEALLYPVALQGPRAAAPVRPGARRREACRDRPGRRRGLPRRRDLSALLRRGRARPRRHRRRASAGGDRRAADGRGPGVGHADAALDGAHAGLFRKPRRDAHAALRRQRLFRGRHGARVGAADASLLPGIISATERRAYRGRTASNGHACTSRRRLLRPAYYGVTAVPL